MQTLEQAAADRNAARTLATPPTTVQQQLRMTELEPPRPATCAAKQATTAESLPVAENGRSGDNEGGQASQAAVANARLVAGGAELTTSPRPSTCPPSVGPRRELGTVAGNRGNIGNGCEAMLKGDEAAATAAATATEELAESLPAIATETAPPTTNTAVNSRKTTADDTKSASSNTAPRDHDSKTEAGNSPSSNNISDSAVNSAAGTKIDARPSEEWSDQFRDRRLMEDTFRRRALLRQLFSPDAESETEYPEDEYGIGVGGRASGKRSGGSLRKKSGQGEVHHAPSDSSALRIGQACL